VAVEGCDCYLRFMRTEGMIGPSCAADPPKRGKGEEGPRAGDIIFRQLTGGCLVQG
jgi:hypothetical protein